MATPSHVLRSARNLLTGSASQYRFFQSSRCFAADSRKLNEETSDEIKYWRGKIFEEEKERQLAQIGRLEKIKVNYFGLPDNQVLIMNKCTSTPYNCAQHLGEKDVNEIVVALVNDKPWDSHRPLVGDCDLNILSSQSPEKDRIELVNQTLWRSFSIMLGAVIENSFKSQYNIELHSFPAPDVRSGSFVYDVDMGELEWNPTKMEMKMLSAQMMKLSAADLPFEPLDVSVDLAQEIFQNNKYKSDQIPHMASTDKTVTVYRLGDHYEVSRGPVMTRTSLLGRCSVTALHPIETKIGRLWRFQGVGLTKDVHLNSMAYGIIENRGSKLNRCRGPSQTGG